MGGDRNERDNPGVIAPPPLIYLGFLVMGLLLDYVWPVALVPDGAQYPAGFALIAVGLVMFALAVREFLKAGTSVETRKPTTVILTSGPFRYTRNPIYLSLSLVYTGIGFAVGSAWVLALLVPALIVMRYGVVSREERYLERKFGEAYLRYKASVRRWV